MSRRLGQHRPLVVLLRRQHRGGERRPPRAPWPPSPSPSACLAVLLDLEQHPPLHQEVGDFHEDPVCGGGHGSRAKVPQPSSPSARSGSNTLRSPPAGCRWMVSPSSRCCALGGCGRGFPSRSRRGSRATRSCRSHRDPARPGRARATPARPAPQWSRRAGSWSRPRVAARRVAARVVRPQDRRPNADARPRVLVGGGCPHRLGQQRPAHSDLAHGQVVHRLREAGSSKSRNSSSLVIGANSITGRQSFPPSPSAISWPTRSPSRIQPSSYIGIEGRSRSRIDPGGFAGRSP